ncbi:MAG: alanine--glyoxylate aminotransferase family protein [Candidatus Aminicenantes bacterium]|nr:MAG: alanine--glyoxylate aminotransferase family protein [Candidatus Aminicenantes bacterium]
MQKEKLLMIPGPSPVHPRILNSLSLPTVSHVSPELVAELKEALTNLKKIVFCEEGEPFIVAGAGTLAMEMALLNTVGKGENLLVLSQGFFGERMTQIARSFDLSFDLIESEWGKAVLPEELEKKISEKEYRAVVSTHVDTCTGACAPVMEYAEKLKRRDILFIVDGVCATGGIEERMDDWGIDVILTAAQKCFGAPPGLSVLVLSERAMEKRREMKAIPAYYSDLLNWLPIMKDPSKYFSTPCVNEIRAFYEGTKIVLEEGMEKRFLRHARTAEAIRKALLALGFSLFTQEPFLADTLSVVQYPEEIEDKSFRSKFAENGVVVAGGLAEMAGKVFRIGHMGNLSISQVLFAIDALEITLSSLGYSFERSTGLKVAREILEETVS